MSSSHPPRNSEAQDEDLEGIEGWLIVPVINLAAIILLCAFLVVKELASSRLSLAALIIATPAAYAIWCLRLLFQKKKLAGYLIMALYALALAVDVVLLVIGHASIPLFIRMGLASALFLYFAFSRRVEQTLVN
jgi:hypothetical protein